MSDDQAFPLLYVSKNNSTGDTYDHQSIGGLTKREYFAGLCLGGILANTYGDMEKKDSEKVAARQALGFADALLKALEGRGS